LIEAKKAGVSSEGREKARVESWDRDKRLAEEGSISAELSLGITTEGASAYESAKARVIRERCCQKVSRLQGRANMLERTSAWAWLETASGCHSQAVSGPTFRVRLP
jgi:hypothetical protein